MKTEDALREYLVERGFVEKGTPREELYRKQLGQGAHVGLLRSGLSHLRLQEIANGP